MWGRMGFPYGESFKPIRREQKRHPAPLNGQAYENSRVLYMAIEPGNKQWKLVFGERSKQHHVAVEADDLVELGKA